MNKLPKKTIKVIFLDVDGVLNRCPETKERVGGGGPGGIIGIDRELAQRFNNLLAATGAHFVVSSTWRLSPTYQKDIGEGGVNFTKCLGRTGSHPSRFRGEEVDAWLQEHPEVGQYAILDDDSDFYPWQPHFKTDYFHGALTEEIVWKVIQHLDLTP